MNHELTAKYNMCKALKITLANNSSIYTTYVPFATAVTNFNTELGNWEGLLPATANTTVGVSGNKAVAKMDMAKYWSALGNTVYAYALANANQSLADNVHYSAREILNQADNESVALCQNMRAVINGLVAPTNLLVAYGVTAANITAGDAKIEAFGALLGVAKSQQNSGAALTTQIKLQVQNKINPLLIQMDAMVKGVFFMNNAVFIENYMNAREIVNIGVHHTTLDVKVVDEATMQPIEGVKVVLDGTDKFAITTADGLATISEFKGGANLKFIFAAIDYVQRTILYNIPVGSHSTQEVHLSKI